MSRPVCEASLLPRGLGIPLPERRLAPIDRRLRLQLMCADTLVLNFIQLEKRFLHAPYSVCYLRTLLGNIAAGTRLRDSAQRNFIPSCMFSRGRLGMRGVGEWLSLTPFHVNTMVFIWCRIHSHHTTRRVRYLALWSRLYLR